MEPNAPPPWLMFAIMFVAVSVFVGLMIVFAGISRVLRGESFWVPREHATPRLASGGVRSVALKGRFRRANAVQTRAPRPNAEKAAVPPVRPFAERSSVPPSTPVIAADLPATLDELQRLAHTIVLYAKRPNKELAILEAWGATKGQSPDYQRASALFDAAMSDAARQAARAKPAPAPAPRREVEPA